MHLNILKFSQPSGSLGVFSLFVFVQVSDNQETMHIHVHVFIILAYFTTYYFLVHFF